MLQEKFKPQPHPFKAKFQGYGIPISHTALFFGYSYTHFLNILNGVSPMPSSLENKLELFFFEHEKSAKEVPILQGGSS